MITVDGNDYYSITEYFEKKGEAISFTDAIEMAKIMKEISNENRYSIHQQTTKHLTRNVYRVEAFDEFISL